MKQARTLFTHLKRLPRKVFITAGAACLAVCIVTVIITFLVASSESGLQTDYEDIVVNGDFGAPVVITMPDNFQEPTKTESRALIKGDGKNISESSAVLLRTTSFDSRTGAIISKHGGGTLHIVPVDEEGYIAPMNDEVLASLAPLLVGEKEGTRLLIARPEKVDGGSASEIIVMDILSSSVRGESKDPSAYVTEVIPEVSLSDQGVPQIHAQGKRIDKMSAVTLIPGSGPQVDTKQRLAIQYVVTDAQGVIIDNTWEAGSPVLVNLDEVMEGLQEGLENQKVGSRVLVLIPSSLAKGEGDRIAVIDILAAETNQRGKKK